MKQNKSILMTGVPLARGTPDHYENLGDFAATAFDMEKQAVIEVHTPQCTLRRIHELMHAQHTNFDDKRAYAAFPDIVAQFVEDCRIHLHHWPWHGRTTPAVIADDVYSYIEKDAVHVHEAVAEGKCEAASFPVFAGLTRACCVLQPIDEQRAADIRGTIPEGLQYIHSRTVDLISGGAHREAALEITRLFFPEWFEKKEKDPHKKSTKKYNSSMKGPREDGEPLDELLTEIYGSGMRGNPTMEIIDLPKTERTTSEIDGIRVATSGSRLHRPALRRPVLTARMFLRHSPVSPGGTTLIDASGSMGEWDTLYEVMKRDPHGTIAYYAGDAAGHGWLYIYASGGFKAAQPVKPQGGGNTVDGPAMDWLLQQAAPRVMITDRQFCDVWDSHLQIARLKMLEASGEITVQDYVRKK